MTRMVIVNKGRRRKRVDHIGANYPYDEWLDGQIRILEQGIDFHCSPQQLRQHLYVSFPGEFSCVIDGDDLQVESRLTPQG